MTRYAEVSYTYSGGSKVFTIPFDYIKASYIHVYIDDEETTNFDFNTTSQIEINDELESSQVVKIVRETPITTKLVNFNDRSILNAATQNLNSDQLFNSLQENLDAVADFKDSIENDFEDYKDAIEDSFGDYKTAIEGSFEDYKTAIEGSFETYKGTIDGNITTISNSVATANTNASNAVTTANSAVSTANTANSKADTAISTANTANTNASTALSTANTASTNASNAVSTANNASSTATAASNKVDSFETDIAVVISAADKINELTEAVMTATTAAGTATQKAQLASDKADIATQKAQEATQAASTFKQSDWDETDTTDSGYIKNKPTIPTVPTDVSAFNNDAGYLTSHQDISGKEDVAKAMNVLETSGTIALTDNSVNSITPTGNVTFTLPTVIDNTKFHQIFVQMNMPTTAYTIDMGLGIPPHWLTEEEPDLSSTGNYNLYWEYDKANQYWKGDALKEGVGS